MINPALNAAMFSLYKSDFERAKYQAELNKAIKHLRKAGLDEISITLTAEQVRQIEQAKAEGKELKVTISLP